MLARSPGATPPGGVTARALPSAAVFTVATVVGVLHRNALTTPWADDRALSADPTWFQFAAPVWHTVISGSMSIANAATRVFDPLTSASTLGDARAVAALLTALAAAALLTILRRCRVPLPISVLLCLSLTAQVLPVATSSSVADAVQLLAAAGLMLAWASPSLTGARRLTVLAALSIVGALNHASFLAFATGVWIAEWHDAAAGRRGHTLAASAGSLAVALFGAVWILHTAVTSAPDMRVETPGTIALAVALITGRFTAELQPGLQGSLREAAALISPGPMMLCGPLAVLGCVAPHTRRIAVACLLSGAGVFIFAMRTWLPDLAIATTPARAVVLVLIGMGLAWLWAQPLRGASVLAVLVSAFLGLFGFAGDSRSMAARESAEMQAFVESAYHDIGDAAWSADRVATARAMLQRDDTGRRHARVRSGAGMLAAVPSDRRLVALTGDQRRMQDDGAFVLPRELAHRSAAGFVASQPPGRWLAVALRGEPAGDFCRAFIDRLGGGDATSSPNSTGRVVLARVGESAATVAADGRLDVPFGHLVAGEPVPARFELETVPAAQVTVNGITSAAVVDGMVFSVFDSWRAEAVSWRVGDCRDPVLPTIGDRRLRAALVVESNGITTLPDVGVLASTALNVPLGEAGNAWFGAGWHGPEAAGENAVRWTGALNADVHVIVSHQQAVRLQIGAHLAERHPGSNRLSVSWNGTPLPPPSTNERAQREWVISKAQVRRGVNVLTVHVTELISPAALGNSSDDRLLGAAVSHLSFVPIPPATAGASLTGPR